MIMILDSDQNHQSIEFWWFLLVRVSWTRWGLRSWQWLQHKKGASLSILIWYVQQGAVATMTWIQNFHYASHPVSERNSLTKEHRSMCGILYPEIKLVWSYYTVLRYHQSRSNGSSASAGRSPRRWRISDIVFRQVRRAQGRRAPTAEVNQQSKPERKQLTTWISPSAWQSSCIEFLELPANGFAHQKKTQLRKKIHLPRLIGILRRQNATKRCMSTTRKETKFQCQDDPSWHAG